MAMYNCVITNVNFKPSNRSTLQITNSNITDSNSWNVDITIDKSYSQNNSFVAPLTAQMTDSIDNGSTIGTDTPYTANNSIFHNTRFDIRDGSEFNNTNLANVTITIHGNSEQRTTVFMQSSLDQSYVANGKLELRTSRISNSTLEPDEMIATESTITTSFTAEHLELNQSSMSNCFISHTELTAEDSVMIRVSWKNVHANIYNSQGKVIHLAENIRLNYISGSTVQFDTQLVDKTGAPSLTASPNKVALTISTLIDTDLSDSKLDGIYLDFALEADVRPRNTKLNRVSLTSSSFFYHPNFGELRQTSEWANPHCLMTIDTSDNEVQGLNLSNSSIAGLCTYVAFPFWSECMLSAASAMQAGMITDDQTNFGNNSYCEDYAPYGLLIALLSATSLCCVTIFAALSCCATMKMKDRAEKLDNAALDKIDNFSPSALTDDATPDTLLSTRLSF